jgi:hypothetical protein
MAKANSVCAVGICSRGTATLLRLRQNYGEGRDIAKLQEAQEKAQSYIDPTAEDLDLVSQP